MPTNLKLTMGLAMGALLGFAGARGMDAWQTKTPPAYVIAEVSVTDAAGMQKYAAKVAETMAPFPHRYLIRAGKTQALEGDPPKTIIVIGFDSAEQARAWYDSAEYQAIKPIRQGAATSRIFIAEGLAPE